MVDDKHEQIPEVQQKLRQALVGELGEVARELPSHAWTEFGLTIGVDAADAMSVFELLKNADPFLFNMLIDVSAVDWMDRREPRFEVIYHLLSLTHSHRLCVRIGAEEDKPQVPSMVSLWPAANFLEREVWDMFGIEFTDHGDLRRILMYDEFVGHPLRKDYPVQGKQPRVKLRVPELRNKSADMHKETLVSLPVRQGTAVQKG